VAEPLAETGPAEESSPIGAVAVAYVHSNQVAYSWHHSMIEMTGFDLFNEARILRGGWIAVRYGTDGLPEARNMAAKIFLEERKAEWLFWVDTDMGFSPDIVERLLEAADPVERPIVGALAFSYRESEPDGLGGWRCHPTPTVFDWLRLDDGQMGFAVRFDYPRDTLVQVGGTGSACVLIHRSALERMREAYGPVWYDKVPNTSTGQVVSEDLSMCLRAGALQIPVHVHTGVRTTHQKTLWLAEGDYYGQVALSQMAPSVPPATEAAAVIVPVLGRPQNAKPFMESLRASTSLATVYAVADGDDRATREAWWDAGAEVISGNKRDRSYNDERYVTTFAEKVNLAYEKTTEPWLFLVGDDVRFEPGWLDHAQHAARDGAHVIGTNDLHNPLVTSGEHGTHLLVRRAYVDERGASWDGPKVVCHEGYRHNFVDDEIVAAAKQRGVWAMAAHSKVEHLHPMWGLAEVDDTYRLGQSSFEQDKGLFEARSAEHA
jgi:hypothetical protein